MGKVCSDEMSVDSFDKIFDAIDDAFYYVAQLESAVVIVCAVILFGCYRRLSKPTFVWVMWGFLILAEVAHLAETIFKMELDKAADAGDN